MLLKNTLPLSALLRQSPKFLTVLLFACVPVFETVDAADGIASRNSSRPTGLPSSEKVGEVFRDESGKIIPRPSFGNHQPLAQSSERSTPSPSPVLVQQNTLPAPALVTGAATVGARSLPNLRQKEEPGDIVAVRLANETRHASPPGMVTFGQVFRPGDWPGATPLQVDYNGQAQAAQSDIKAYHSDGSVRHAVVTVASPALAAGGHVDLMLRRGGATTGAPAANNPQHSEYIERFQQQFDIQITLQMRHTGALVDRVVISADKVIGQALRENAYKLWLDGPLASEAEMRVSVTPRLDIRFNIRVAADKSWRADIIFENTKTFVPGRTDLIYNVTVTSAGKTAFEYADLTHFRHTRWRARIESTETIRPRLIHDADYIIATRAVPSYDTSLGVSGHSLEQSWRDLQSSDLSPMGNAGIVKYMPQGGGRDDIGPMPTWSVRYLLSMDARAAEVMYRKADAAGAVPWHFRTEETDLPPTLDAHPALWIDYRGQVALGQKNALPDPFNIEVTEWTLDDAHQPALTYFPYLLSGDKYYLDELIMQAGYMLLSTDPNRRQFELGFRDWGQVRGQAWTLRTLGDAAYILPDAHPLKIYFLEKLNNNLNRFVQRYVINREMSVAGELEGYILGVYATEGALAPWQDDYFTIILAHLVDRGFEAGAPLLQWKANFTAGRFLAGAKGFNPRAATSYALHTFNPASGERFKQWSTAFAETPPAHWRHTDDNRPLAAMVNSEDPGDYGGLARAALASLLSYNAPGAAEAFAFVARETFGVTHRFADNPSWNIAPRSGADGEAIPLAAQFNAALTRIQQGGGAAPSETKRQ